MMYLLCWKIVQLPKVKMAATAIFDFEKNCCRFFATWPIFAKFGGIVVLRSITHIVFRKSAATKIQNGGYHHLSYFGKKTVSMYSLFDLFSPNLVGKCEFDWKGICVVEKLHLDHYSRWWLHNLEFRKTFAIPLIFDRSSPNFIGLLWIRLRTRLSCRKKWPKFKVAVQQEWGC